jgi:hypothetical protein
VNIYVDWRELEEAGIGQSAPVNVNVKNVAAGQVLKLALRGVSKDLQYQIDEGVVVIFTANPAPRAADLVTRAYDVTDLLAGPGANQPNPPDDRRQQKLSELAAIIRDTVAPESWRENGGGEGTIKWFNNKLIVSAPDARHREVEKVLDMLRDKAEATPAQPGKQGR